MEHKAWLTGVLMVAVALAGCLQGNGGATGAPEAPEGPGFTEDTGAVTGMVTDEEGLPVDGAQVGLIGTGYEQLTTTDPSGIFHLRNVPPGQYQLFVQKLGFDSVGRNVQVLAGQAVELELVLPARALEEPHHLTQIGEGKVGCGVRFYPGAPLTGVGDPGWYTGVAVCGIGPLGGITEDNFLINYELDEGPQEVLLEMAWQSTQATGRGLSVVLEHRGHANQADYTFGRDTGTSPLIIYANATKMLDVEETSGIRCDAMRCPVFTRVFAEANTTNLDWPTDPPTVPVFGQMHKRLLDVGIVWDQRFTQYLTTFHHMEKPENFSAREDA